MPGIVEERHIGITHRMGEAPKRLVHAPLVEIGRHYRIESTPLKRLPDRPRITSGIGER